MKNHPNRGDTVIQIENGRNSPQGCFAVCVEKSAIFFSILGVVLTFPFSLIVCFKMVKEYERAIIFRLGKLRSGEPRGPGLFFTLACIDEISIVDLRTVTCIVEPQEILTRDSVTVSVDAVVYHRVSNPLNAIIKVRNYGHSTRLLAQSTLRTVLGTKDLSELLTDREAIVRIMQSTLEHATYVWGVEVERVEITDVKLPVQLQRAMAAEAEAARETRAKIVSAEGEKKVSHALKEASDIMAKSQSSLQLRYLQTLSSIASEKTSTIVFPIPMEMVRGILATEKKSNA